MLTLITIAGLILLTGWAVYKIIQKSQKGGGCCGEHEISARRIIIADRNKSHYPYKYTLTIGGMTCENCAIKVENALNALPGTWAKADIADSKASVLMKTEPDLKILRKAVSDAGYVVTKID